MAEPIFGKSNLIFTLAAADGLAAHPAGRHRLERGRDGGSVAGLVSILGVAQLKWEKPENKGCERTLAPLIFGIFSRTA